MRDAEILDLFDRYHDLVYRLALSCTRHPQDAEDVVSPVELRADSRLYLTANGENLDITELCSNEKPYLYDCVDQAGARHVFLIGGEPESIGWVECMFDSADDTTVSGLVMNLAENADPANRPWLDAGLEQLGVSLGGVEIS